MESSAGPSTPQRPDDGDDEGYNGAGASSVGTSRLGDFETSTTPRSDDSYSYTYSSYTPSSAISDRSSVLTTATARGEGTPPFLDRLAEGTRQWFCAVDNAFSWLAEPHESQPPSRVPPPPPPERRNEALSRHTIRDGQSSLEWKEIAELRLALAENAASQHGLALELKSKDVEAQALARSGEQELQGKQEALRELRERVDTVPAARAQCLEELHAQLHAATAELEAARVALASERADAADAERAEWQVAEESVAKLAAEAARETRAAEAAEAAALESIGKQTAKLARFESSLGDAALGTLAASRRARAAVVRDELTMRRVAAPRFSHEPPALLARRLATMRRGTRFTRRHGGDAEGEGELELRLSSDRPPRLLLADGEAPLVLGDCVRVCVGPVEWLHPELLEAVGAPLPPPPPDGRAHLCVSLLFGSAHNEAPPSPPLHLVGHSLADLEAWVLGLQPLCSVSPAERVSAARLRWKVLRACARWMRGRYAELAFK